MDYVREARRYPFTFERISDEDGGGYLAYSTAFPGILGDGEEMDDAANDLETLLADIIQRRIEKGMALPPRKAVQEDGAKEYSGKLSLRVSRSVHRDLSERAMYEGVSINTLIVGYISHGLGEARRARIAKPVETIDYEKWAFYSAYKQKMDMTDKEYMQREWMHSWQN